MKKTFIYKAEAGAEETFQCASLEDAINHIHPCAVVKPFGISGRVWRVLVEDSQEGMLREMSEQEVATEYAKKSQFSSHSEVSHARIIAQTMNGLIISYMHTYTYGNHQKRSEDRIIFVTNDGCIRWDNIA